MLNHIIIVFITTQGILTNAEDAFVCARFRSRKVRLESRRGSRRKSCTRLPEALRPMSTTPMTSPVTTSDTMTTVLSSTTKMTTTDGQERETEPVYNIITGKIIDNRHPCRASMRPLAIPSWKGGHIKIKQTE